MKLRLALVVLLAGSMTAPAWAAVSEDDIREAESRLAGAQARADELTAEYEAALSESYELERRMTALALAVQELDLELGSTRELVADRAVEIYMRAAGGQLSSLMVSNTLTEAGAGLAYLGVVAGDDLALVRSLEAQEAEVERQRADLRIVRDDHQAQLATLQNTADRLLLELEAAQAEYRELVAQREAELAEARRRAEEEARRQAEAEAAARAATSTTAVGPTTSTVASDTSTTTTTVAPAAGQTCPVNGPHSFTDTWGAPRSGGRTHQGVDMLAARGTDVVAVEAGTIRRLGNSTLGGITVWLRSNGGDEFYYAHLDGWAPGVFEGMSVGAGALLGYVGTTGNAPAHVPHLHFEFHPGGGGAINPTPLVTALCR